MFPKVGKLYKLQYAYVGHAVIGQVTPDPRDETVFILEVAQQLPGITIIKFLTLDGNKDVVHVATRLLRKRFAPADEPTEQERSET